MARIAFSAGDSLEIRGRRTYVLPLLAGPLPAVDALEQLAEEVEALTDAEGEKAHYFELNVLLQQSAEYLAETKPRIRTIPLDHLYARIRTHLEKLYKPPVGSADTSPP